MEALEFWDGGSNGHVTIKLFICSNDLICGPEIKPYLPINKRVLPINKLVNRQLRAPTY